MDVLSATPIEISEGLRGDADAQLEALVVLGRAAQEPNADLDALRTRQAAVRALMAPPAPAAGPLVICSRSDGARPLKTSRWFWKEVCRPGYFVHPTHGYEFELKPERCARIAEQTNRYLDKVGTIPFTVSDGDSADHEVNQERTFGYWHAMQASTDGRLFGLLEVSNDEVARRIGTDIRYVSMSVSPELRDEHGGRYTEAIDHICGTSTPVITKQANFERIAASRSGAPGGAPLVPKEDDPMKLSEATAAALKLSREPSPEALEAKILELSKKAGEAADLKTKVDALEAAEQKRDEDALAKLIKASKTVALSKNAKFDDGDVAVVTSLWQGGQKDQARTFAKRIAGAGMKVELAAGAEPYPNADAEDEVKKQADLAYKAQAAETHGFSVQWAPDRKSFTASKTDEQGKEHKLAFAL